MYIHIFTVVSIFLINFLADTFSLLLNIIPVFYSFSCIYTYLIIAMEISRFCIIFVCVLAGWFMLIKQTVWWNRLMSIKLSRPMFSSMPPPPTCEVHHADRWTIRFFTTVPRREPRFSIHPVDARAHEYLGINLDIKTASYSSSSPTTIR